MIYSFFEQQMARLVGLRFRPAELQTHWEALEDMPDAALEAAVTYAQRTRVDFPTPLELRRDADMAAVPPALLEDDPERTTPLDAPYAITFQQGGAVIPVRESWRYDCETCGDSGWEPVWCGAFTAVRKPWQEPRTCDRRGAHASHEWVRPCACWDTNRTLVRRRDAQKKYAEKPGKAA